MWDALAIHPVIECRKHCPFCYAGGAGPEKPQAFFKDLLKFSREVPQWIFACNWAGPQAWEKIVGLVQCAGHYRHPYALTTNYENICAQHLPIFQRAEYVAVSLDEYKVSVHLFDDFLRVLEQARRQGVRLRVIATLTAPVIMKIVYGNLLGALCQRVERVYLNLPKTPDRIWTEPSMVEVFLRYYHQKIGDRGFFEKVELDPCLKTRLSIWQDMTGTACAYRRVLTIMPDGLMKICPYTRAGFLLHKPAEIKTVLGQADTLQQKIAPQCFLPFLEMKGKEMASCA